MTIEKLKSHLLKDCPKSRHCKGCQIYFNTITEYRTHIQTSCAVQHIPCNLCHESFDRRDFGDIKIHSCFSQLLVLAHSEKDAIQEVSAKELEVVNDLSKKLTKELNNLQEKLNPIGLACKHHPQNISAIWRHQDTCNSCNRKNTKTYTFNGCICYLCFCNICFIKAYLNI